MSAQKRSQMLTSTPLIWEALPNSSKTMLPAAQTKPPSDVNVTQVPVPRTTFPSASRKLGPGIASWMVAYPLENVTKIGPVMIPPVCFPYRSKNVVRVTVCSMCASNGNPQTPSPKSTSNVSPDVSRVGGVAPAGEASNVPRIIATSAEAASSLRIVTTPLQGVGNRLTLSSVRSSPHRPEVVGSLLRVSSSLDDQKGFVTMSASTSETIAMFAVVSREQGPTTA